MARLDRVLLKHSVDCYSVRKLADRWRMGLIVSFGLRSIYTESRLQVFRCFSRDQIRVRLERLDWMLRPGQRLFILLEDAGG